MYKNVAGQKIAVYAHDTAADGPKTGDAANITATVSKDGGAPAATNDVNPTELSATDAKGVYVFDLTQSETDADLMVLCAGSATGGVQIEPVMVYTVPPKADIAGAVLDETLADHQTVGSVGEELHLAKAMLANERVHTISTGVDVIKDDDGQTTLRTMTPEDDGDDTIRVVPS